MHFPQRSYEQGGKVDNFKALRCGFFVVVLWGFLSYRGNDSSGSDSWSCAHVTFLEPRSAKLQSLNSSPGRLKAAQRNGRKT